MNVYSALADDTRRDILKLLSKRGELSVADICEGFEISHSAISQHLKVLRDANLVAVQKQAQRRIYSVDRAGFEPIENWLETLKSLWNRRLDALDQLLREKKEP